jgi:glycosyltransferase involved in cell wall biosynthesis
MRILLLTSDAFGGHGGIAQYNRDLLTALSSMPEVKEIVAIPRFIPGPVGDLPPKLTYHIEGVGSKIRYGKTVLKVLRGRFDLVICGHINLLSLAWLASIKSRTSLVLLVYGIDVWQPHESTAVRLLLKQTDAIWSISEITRGKMVMWSKVDIDRFHILPNAIDLDYYGLGPKNVELAARYGLRGQKVMMTLARLASAERYKGVDELLALMPDLLATESALVFLVAGDGDDRARLEVKAKTLGITEHVIFIGYVSESEKVAHFRLADVFAMPGRGEGFGFVFLEAMACGVPVVASTLDGSREAVRFGMLGQMVNPDDRTALSGAIIKALNSEKKIPEGLDYFSFANFQSRLQALVVAAISK